MESILDMLEGLGTPEEEECGAPGGEICTGLVEGVCPECGETFYYHRGMHAYVRTRNGGKECRYDRYSCMRAADEREEARKKEAKKRQAAQMIRRVWTRIKEQEEKLEEGERNAMTESEKRMIRRKIKTDKEYIHRKLIEIAEVKK